MMKDNSLNEIFQQYADEFAPQSENLTQKAHQQMAKTRKSKVTLRILASVLCCLVICFVSFTIFNNLFGNNHESPAPDNDGVMGDENANTTMQIQRYSRNQLKANGCKSSDIAVVDMQLLSQSYTIVSEKYYAYYLDGQIVCYQAVFGIVCENGIAEVSLLVEKDGYLRNDLANTYYNCMTDTLCTYQTVAQNGEYLTNAYLQSQNFHCYLQVAGDWQSGESIAYAILQNNF